MKVKLAFDLIEARHRLENLKQRPVSLAEIARESGLSYDSLYRASRGDYNGIQFETLEKLIDYFRGQGVEVIVGDFIVEVDAEGKDVPASQEMALIG